MGTRNITVIPGYSGSFRVIPVNTLTGVDGAEEVRFLSYRNWYSL